MDDAGSNPDARGSIMHASIPGRLLLLAALIMPAFPARAAEMPVTVIAELVSKPDRADALRDLMVAFAEGSRHEPGCLHYTLTEDAKQPGRFMTFEVWADQASIEAHMQTPAIKAAVPKLGDILAKPFTQAFLRTLSAS